MSTVEPAHRKQTLLRVIGISDALMSAFDRKQTWSSEARTMNCHIALEEHWAIDETLNIVGQPVSAAKVRCPHHPLLLSGSKDHAAETEQGESEVDTANHSHCRE